MPHAIADRLTRPRRVGLFGASAVPLAAVRPPVEPVTLDAADRDALLACDALFVGPDREADYEALMPPGDGPPAVVVRPSADGSAFSLWPLGGVTPLAAESPDAPAAWLADVLHRADASWLAGLFQTSRDGPTLRRALDAFRTAYPNDPLVPELEVLVTRPRRTAWLLAPLAVAVVLLLAWLWPPAPLPPPEPRWFDDELVTEPPGPPPSPIEKRVIDREKETAAYRDLGERLRQDPIDFAVLRKRADAYLAAHPEGRFREPVTRLVRWCKRISAPSDYRVTLVSGVFDRKAAFWASRGVSPAVALEVAGVTYGPGPIAVNDYAPKWNHEFARPIRWKSGDAVRIVVTDHFTWKRTLADVMLNGPMALTRLNDAIDFKNGSVRFEVDFALPSLPEAD